VLYEYLAFKHLRAVQYVPRSVAGASSCGPDNACTIQSIESGNRGIKLPALVKVDLMTSEIEACSNCSHSED